MLRVQDLRVYYGTTRGDARVVDDVSFNVYENEVFGIAGESGCGKSTLVEGILRLIKPPGYIKTGKVLYNGTDLLKLKEADLNAIRWKEISYIPQGSMNSLNPVLRVKDQLLDAVEDHEKVTEQEVNDRISRLLETVGLPEEVTRMYPHELSGGMKQRVIIAMSMLLGPTLIIADEPTTALDLTVQKAILQSIVKAKKRYESTVIIVCHDMAVHAEIADRVVIMYAGKICEIGNVNTIFESPLHPYSKLLIATIPSLEKRDLKGIPGLPPSPLNWPNGCRFHPRCPFSFEKCEHESPSVLEVETGHFVACHRL